MQTSHAVVLSTDEIRARFPALKRRYGQVPVAYFDGPGGTQVPQSVVDAMVEYLLHHNANTHWRFPTSIETDEALDSARRALADFLNASPREIAFGNNMTTITFHVARALGRGWGEGDEVVVTELDHHANVAPWQALARERGVTVRTVRMIPETGMLDWDDLERTVNARTRLLALGAASNALGTVNDIPRAARLVHAVGGLLFVDAVHYAAHLPVDVRAFACDLLVCSAYKFYGPHVGVLYGRGDLLARLDVPKLQPAPDTVPERIETGTQNHEGIVGAAAAVDFLAGLAAGAANRRAALESSVGALHDRGQALLARLHAGLTAIRGVTVYGPPPDVPRTPTLSFTVAGRTSDEVARELASRGLFLSNGNFYAATVEERLLGRTGDGFVRAGCACYTSTEEVDRLIAAVADTVV
ncbi:MAG TPA: cysteine desulfurase-like protein [Vicinamibacterales bacterium]|nr:cysteine desulfurase-like protein [Vicinamibacterales bacterium]